MEQFLLLTSYDSPAGIRASLLTDERTNEQTDGWTHRRDVGNSILDDSGSSILGLSNEVYNFLVAQKF